MYVLVHHTVHQPGRFWSAAQDGLGNMPDHLVLHHTLSAKDGTRATCLWEAESVEDVSNFLEPLLGDVASNEYREAENREGIAVPEGMRAAASG